MNLPFTAKLRAQIQTLETDLAAARGETRAALLERDTAIRERDAHKAAFDGVEPGIEERAQARAIDLIANTGTLGPLATGEGKLASSDEPRTKAEFIERYAKLDGEEAGAYFDKHGHLLG